MEILHPQLAWLALLALAPILLYLIRKRIEAVQVSTLVFFRSLAREHRERPWLRQFKRWLSLLLTLFMILGTVAALMRILVLDRGDTTKNVVVLLDRSASMGALTGESGTRLDRARDAVRAGLKRLNPETTISVVAFDQNPEVVVPSRRDPAEVAEALERVEVHTVEGEPARAVELAEVLAHRETPAEIWWASDAPPPATASAEDDAVRWVTIPTGRRPRINVGLTALRLRPLPLQRGRRSCFLEMACHAPEGEEVEARLEIQVGSVSYPARTLKLRGGERESLEFSVEGVADQEMRLRLVAEGDCLEADDTMLLRLPEVRPLVVVRVGPRDALDPFLHVALQSLVKEGELQIWSALPEQWPIRDADVVLFDHWIPPEWPDDVPAVVVSPSAGAGPVRAAPLRQGGIPQPGFRVTDEDHPVLFRVSSDRLAVKQTSKLEPVAGLEPLWMADEEPLLIAGEREGKRVVVLGFSPYESPQLPLTSSFPLLIGNAIYWCAEGTDSTARGRPSVARTGHLVPVEGTEVRWWTLRDGRSIGSSRPVRRGLLELDRAGIWETDAGESGAAHLLSLTETLQAGNVPAEESVPGSARPRTGTGWQLPRDLTVPILAGLLVLLILESFLFHRHAVY